MRPIALLALVATLALRAAAGLADPPGESLPTIQRERAGYGPVRCEGTYPKHLQGICIDGKGSIYWSFTDSLVKSDVTGKVLKRKPVASHHGDLCHRDGELYVAVNLGKFNDPKGNADSWVYVYDADNLSELARHAVPQAVHGAGGIGCRDGHFIVVGGLPPGANENFVYEYDPTFRFVRRHTIHSGYTLMGIQTAEFAGGCWWFGCYGNPRVLLKTDESFRLLGRYEFDGSLGIAALPEGGFLVARGESGPLKTHIGSVAVAREDAAKGLAVARPPVFAAYYIWYHTGAHPVKPWLHWTHEGVRQTHGDANPLGRPGDPPLASSAYPLAGLYASDDTEMTAWHMRLAQAAGIDAFLVSWWGSHNDTDATFEKTVLPTAEKLGFKVALLDELAQYHRDDAKYQAGLAAVLGRFSRSPAYLHIDDRPVVYLYQVAARPGLTPESFTRVREHVERDVGPVYWIVDKLAHDHQARRPEQVKHIPADWLDVKGIDAFAFYSTFSHFRAHTYDALIGQYRYLVESAHRAGRKMILPVHPGHNNSRFRADFYDMPRRDGQTFRDYLRAATDAGADAILVTSWNEWPETTVIEPSSTWADPYQYVKILAGWSGLSFQPPPAPPSVKMTPAGESETKPRRG